MSHPAHHHPPVLKASSLWLPAEHSWRRFPAIGLVMAALGLGGSLAMGLLSHDGRHQLWHSWLTASLFVLSIALGALFFVLVQHATQAGWSVTVRRLAENVMGTLPYLVLLWVPLIFGMHDLFHWTHADAVAKDHLLQHKAPYLNTPFFLIRTLICFGVWSALAFWFGRQSRLQDETGDHEITRRMRRRSAPALLLYALTVTFFAFDWVMSLNPHWYSTIFGLYVFAGAVMAFLAVLSLIILSQRELLARVVSSEHQHDIAKLLFGFVAFWAYMAFSQYLLIWYANLPEETGFYAQRLNGAWGEMSLALAVLHFVVPFFFLLPRTIKRHPKALAAAAVWLLVLHFFDLYWLVMPNLHVEGIAPSLLDLTTLIGSLGVFVAAFGRLLPRQALVPLRDPRLPESLTFENI